MSIHLVFIDGADGVGKAFGHPYEQLQDAVDEAERRNEELSEHSEEGCGKWFPVFF